MTISILAGAFLVGVSVASGFGPPLPAIALFLCASVLLTALLVVTRRSPMPALLLAALVLGMLRFALTDDAALALAEHHSRIPVQVEGVITSDPEAVGALTRFRLRVEKVGEEEVSGDALVTLRESAALVSLRERPYFRYGDRLLLEGPLEAPEPFADFDYPAYLARQGIGTVMYFPSAILVSEGDGVAFQRWLYSARQRIAESLALAVPEPQASLGQALLLDIRDGIPKGLNESFRVTGASHILSISGLHVGILMGMSIAASQWMLGRRRQLYLILPFALIWFYVLISGASPSATRSAIMGSVYIAALALGRPRSVLPALGFAAALMVAVSSGVLWSVSFQLSFAAMAGIALFSEPLDRLIQSPAARYFAPLRLVSSMTAMTIAATFATLPLVAFYFQQVSLVGLLTTLLVLPALPFVLVAQAAAGLAGLVFAPLASALGWLAWALAAYVTGVVNAVAQLPGAALETGRLAPFLLWLYYALLILPFLSRPLRRAMRRWTASMPKPQPMANLGVPTLVLVPVVLIAALVWTVALSGPDSKLHVVFADVGQGDAIFIATPGGHQILVDGGPDPQRFVSFLGSKMPFRDRTVELVVLTHAHSDHATGLLEALGRYDVERVLERRVDYGGPSYVAWRKALESEGAQVIQAQAGQTIAFGDDVFLQVVSPLERLLHDTASDVDNASVVVRLVYGEVSFLLTGDLFAEGERALLTQNTLIDAAVLKVGHHGSRSSSTAAFLDRVSPSTAVISAGEDNSFGHPHPETIAALQAYVPPELIFTTRDRGAIEFVTDGKRIEVKTER